MKRKILFILFCICSFSSMVASKRTGAQDRELWVKYLCRIASPVIDNLAKGTLEANMPVETGKNFYGNPRDVTYLEAVGTDFHNVRCANSAAHSGSDKTSSG